MKAKTLMGMIACASACVSLSAFGNNTNGWFGVTVDSDITRINCETNGAAVSIKSNKIVLDNAKDTALTITPAVNAPTNSNDGVFVIKATALLTPSSTNDFDVTTNAKAGFAVGVDDQNATNYYGYANGVWNKLEDADVVAEGSETTFKLILNYRDYTVDFYAGADAATHLGKFVLAGGTTAPLGIDAFGAGSITSITGEYEVAVAAYGDNKYGSVAEAIKAAGTEHKADVKPVDGSGNVPESATAKNGLPAVVCSVLGIATDDEDAQAKAVPVENDSETSYVTLQVPVTEAGVVEFEVRDNNGDILDTYDASAILIPTGTGVYTVTPVLK